MTEYYADQELDQADLIDLIDAEFKYHLSKPIKCIPEEFPPEVSLHLPEEKKTMFNAMLVYDYGGVTWDEFSKILNLEVYHVTSFLKSAQIIVDGVQEMLEKGYIHGDLKVNNLLYKHVQRRCNMIDFGHSGTFKYILNVERPTGKHNVLQDRVEWWFPHTCPEKKYQYQQQFLKIREHLNKNFSQCVNDFKLSKGAKAYKFFLLQDENDNEFDQDVEGLFQYLKSVKYTTFLEETLKKLDTYYVAFSLVCATFNFIQNTSTALQQNHAWLKLVKEIRALALQASRIDPRKRRTVEDFANNYSEIITKFNVSDQTKVWTQIFPGNEKSKSDKAKDEPDRKSPEFQSFANNDIQRHHISRLSQ